MTGLSLWSIIGLIVFAVVAVIGIAVKLVLRAKRKKVDGAHGFVPQTVEEAVGDGWEIL